MTKLTFFRNKEHYMGFDCRGHSDFAESGSDIVCAAVSAAVQLCAEYLCSYYKDDIELFVDENNTQITLRCRVPLTDADKQLSVLERFSESISEQYPDYFTFDFMEV